MAADISATRLLHIVGFAKGSSCGFKVMTASNASTAPSGNDPGLGIIFSSLDGYVWASWPDSNATIRLGRHEVVAAMMRDFLAQDSLGKRLDRRPQAGK